MARGLLMLLLRLMLNLRLMLLFSMEDTGDITAMPSKPTDHILPTDMDTHLPTAMVLVTMARGLLMLSLRLMLNLRLMLLFSMEDTEDITVMPSKPTDLILPMDMDTHLPTVMVLVMVPTLIMDKN